MSLISKIQADLLQLRKQSTNKPAISLLTTLYSEAANIGINDGKRETKDDEVIALIKKFIKGIDECLQYATNKDTYHDYLNEKNLLEKYLPKQMSEEDLKVAITIFATAHDQATKADIMKYLKSAFAGQYDGKMASTTVDEYLKSGDYNE